MRASFIFGLIIALLGALFVMQNSQQVDINFLFFEFHSSMALALVSALLAGMLIMAFMGFPFWYEKRKQLRMARKALKSHQQTINSLKKEHLTKETTAE